jgi:hypothetical protein
MLGSVAVAPSLFIFAAESNFFTDTTLGYIVQILVAVAASGVLYKIFFIRQDRRKIAGDASASEANAASTLSGAALLMVQAAQKTAKDAEDRANTANQTAETAKLEANKLWAELNKARWQIHWLQVRESTLENALRDANIPVPTTPSPDEFPAYPPPNSGPSGPMGHQSPKALPPTIDFDS